jgi:hypothetical protein
MRINTTESLSTQFNEHENTKANREAFIREYPLTDFTYVEDMDEYNFNISILRFYFRDQPIAEWHWDEDFEWLRNTEPPWDIILINLYNTQPYRNPSDDFDRGKFRSNYGTTNIITREEFSKLTEEEQEALIILALSGLWTRMENRRKRRR